MFYFFFSIVFASIPASAWRAAEREHYQEAIYDEAKIIESLSSACSQKHKASCQWKKKRRKLASGSDEKVQYFAENCEKGDSWSCVISGWHNSQLSHLPGIPNVTASNISLAEKQFSQACEAGAERACLELLKLQFVTEAISSWDTIHKDLNNYCQNDDAEACYILGYFHAQAIGTEENKLKAEELFTRACTLELGKGCSNQALIQLDRATEFEQAKNVVALYQKGCELGGADSCRWLGQHFEEGLGTERDESKAAQYYEMACTSYHPEACDKLGLLYSEGRGVQENTTKAYALFEKACKAENPFSCYNLAAILETQTPPNLEKARSLLSKSCVYGSGRACFTYGLWQEKGKGGSMDSKSSLQSYGKGCNLNYAPACLNGGIIAYQNKSPKQAAALYEKGCELGELGACSSFGFLLETGDGVPKNTSLAKQYYQQSCNAGDDKSCQRFSQLQGDTQSLQTQCTADFNGDACYDAALRYEKGEYAIQNFVMAVKLISVGCKQEHYRSCSKLAYYHLEGLGLDKDNAKAVEFYQLACTNNEATGCHALGLMHAEGRGFAKNIDSALQYLDKACQLKQSSSCGVVALLYRMQTPINIDKSLEYSQKGCALNDLDSCSQEAFIYTQEPYANLPKAASLFKNYCSQNHAKSCFNYAVMLYQGQGISIDQERSLTIMKYSCTLGYQEACKTLQP